ncbi:hypothetical protein F5Y05DRAFT_45097 [Hypoxylon sp. FL0543]|nr:hypothetical protein F5Y05DRAFT_45097 [Hypoxylon sp. FL0543]
MSSRPASFVKDSHRAVEEGRQSWESPNQPSWNNARFVLRITSFITALLLLGLSLGGFAAPLGFSSYPIMGTPLSVAALLYDIAEFIVMCVRRRKTGIRPAVSLGFELVLSAGGIALATLIVFYTVDSWRLNMYYSGDSSGDRYLPVPHYVSNGEVWFGMSAAASVLAIFLSLIHFVLFVRDCVEVDRERKAAKRARKERVSTGAAHVHVQDPAPDVPAPSYETVELDTYDDFTKSDLVRLSEEMTLSRIIS